MTAAGTSALLGWAQPSRAPVPSIGSNRQGSLLISSAAGQAPLLPANNCSLENKPSGWQLAQRGLQQGGVVRAGGAERHQITVVLASLHKGPDGQ